MKEPCKVIIKKNPKQNWNELNRFYFIPFTESIRFWFAIQHIFEWKKKKSDFNLILILFKWRKKTMDSMMKRVFVIRFFHFWIGFTILDGFFLSSFSAYSFLLVLIWETEGCCIGFVCDNASIIASTVNRYTDNKNSGKNHSKQWKRFLIIRPKAVQFNVEVSNCLEWHVYVWIGGQMHFLNAKQGKKWNGVTCYLQSKMCEFQNGSFWSMFLGCLIR